MAKNTQDCLFPSPRLPVSGEPLESFGGWKAALALSMVGAGAAALFSYAPWSAALAAALLLTVTRWPYGALLALIATSATSRFFVEIFGWKARPEHFAVAFVSVAVGLWFLSHKRGMRLEKLDYWVAAYVVVNYASSALGSPVPSATLRWSILNNLAILPYFLIRFLIQDMETLGRAFRILIGVGIAESVLLAWSLHDPLPAAADERSSASNTKRARHTSSLRGDRVSWVRGPARPYRPDADDVSLSADSEGGTPSDSLPAGE